MEPAGGAGEEHKIELSETPKLKLFKTAKGTIDLLGEEYRIIEDIIKRVKYEFICAGGEPLETPVFERCDVLLGKYGEEAESKLIYRLADEGGEELALRYDLTVPFTRFIKEKGIKQMRRYSIGKVYRRDQPNIKSGRYREFIQADFDIYGEKQEGMLAEASVLNTICNVLKGLGISFKILINDVRNLSYLLELIMTNDSSHTIIKENSFRKICSIIDKLDKQNFESLIEEFEKAGLNKIQISKLKELLLSPIPLFSQTTKDFESLLEIAEIFKFRENIIFTNSLARGLDYYTGFIWEFKVEGISSSISAGGRYDNLLDAPTVGISLGVTRLASIISHKTKETWENTCFVTTVGDISIIDKIKVVKNLQTIMSCPIIYNFVLKDKKLTKIISDCVESKIRYIAIIAEKEFSEKKIILKDLIEKTQILIDL